MSEESPAAVAETVRQFILARAAEYELTSGNERDQILVGAPPFPDDLYLMEGRWTDRAGRDWTDDVAAWWESLPLSAAAQQARRAAAAYRGIVGRHQPEEAWQQDEGGETLIVYCGGCGDLVEDDFCRDLASLASIWEDHPDYPCATL